MAATVVSSNKPDIKGKKQVKFLTEATNEEKMKTKMKRTSSWSPELASTSKDKIKGKKEFDKQNAKKTKVPPQKLNTKRRNSVPPENVADKANVKLKTKVI